MAIPTLQPYVGQNHPAYLLPQRNTELELMPREAYYLPSRKLVSQDDASLIQRARVPRSKFINRFMRKTTFPPTYLIPFMIDEVLPGDHMRYDVTAYVRMATALFPIFDNLRIDTFFFFVPNRLIWTNWVRMMGEQPGGPTDAINYVVPQIVSPVAGHAILTIYDYMGLPTVGQITAGNQYTHNALPLRAYNKIWNEWFRDQNINTAVPDNMGDGPDAVADYAIQTRAKSHDYFTSALPWPQKFTPLQTLFTGTAPVVGIGLSDGTVISAGTNIRQTDGTNPVFPFMQGASVPQIRYDTGGGGVVSATNTPKIYADLAQATGVTINALRQAWLVQDLLERDARGGTRYTELIRSHFGVINPDFRLQRPEYIGGGQTPLNLTPIAQTTPTGGGGLGALGATGTAAGQHRASYAATEHGYIIALINVRSQLSYQQGLHRMWTRVARTDFYFPSLAGLGEQAVLRQEIYCSGVDAEDATVFGYQERWQEYRTRYSDVTGLFRSTSAGNIDEWHLAQVFSPAPTLSPAFIADTPPMARVLAAGGAAANQEFLADILIERTATRPIPTFGTPATLARF